MCIGKSAIVIMNQPIQNIPRDADACAAALQQQQQQQQHQRMEESNGNATTARTGRRRRRRQQVTPITTATSSDDNDAGRQRTQQPTLEPSLSMLENGRALIGDDMGAETITPIIIERNNHHDATPSDDTLPLRIHRSTARVLNQEDISISGGGGQNNTKPGAFPERGRPVGLHPDQIQNTARPQHQNQRGRNRNDQEDQIQLLGLSDRLSSRGFARMIRTQQDVPVATAVLIHRPSLRRQNEYRDGLRSSSSISNSSAGGRRASLPPPTLHRYGSDPTNLSSIVEVSTTVLDRPALLRQDKARGLRCSDVSSNPSHAEGGRTYHRRHSSDPTELLLLDASVRLASMTSQQEDLTFNAIPPELRPAAAAAAAAPREARLPSLIPENNVQKLDSDRRNNNTRLEQFFERITHHHHHQGTNNKDVSRRK